MVIKIFCLYRLNIWKNLLDPVRKIQTVIRMKVDSSKVIYLDFGRNVLNGCGDDHDDMPLSDPYMNLPPRHLQELPCLRLFLLCLEFIIILIEIACSSLLLPNLNPLL